MGGLAWSSSSAEDIPLPKDMIVAILLESACEPARVRRDVMVVGVVVGG